jgi:glycosyltransferase involved in cell wall biosynthesis
VRVLRVIARMNMGGPAYHVALLSERLADRGYTTLLACGTVGAGERELTTAVARLSAPPRRIAGLTPSLAPVADVRALWQLVRLIRRWKPDIVHTHTAKAGFLGRMAARLARRRRPVIVHTYHGHVLEGYFGPALSRAYATLEKLCARFSDRLVGVSQATVDDLVRLGIAPAERFVVIPLGLELDDFLAIPRPRRGPVPFRDEAGAGPDDVLALFVGRFAAIKRLDVLLEAVGCARRQGAPLRLALVGDGEQRPELEALARAEGIAEHVHFAGYREDLVPLITAADVAVLASDNEGTPVSLIQAAAGGLPLVSTAVGGVAEVVREGTGLLTPAGDAEALGGALAALAGDAARRGSLGAAAREQVAARYADSRLAADVDALYGELLTAARKSS